MKTLALIIMLVCGKAEKTHKKIDGEKTYHVYKNGVKYEFCYKDEVYNAFINKPIYNESYECE